MSRRWRAGVAVAVAVVVLPGLPLAGRWLAGDGVAGLLAFPPRPAAVEHPAFSFTAWLLVVLLVLASVAPFLRILLLARRGHDTVADGGAFPWWGWAGLALAGAGWWLAWTRYGWFAPLQRYTFLPLWLGYVLVVNALCQSRTGGSPLTRHGWRWLMLFPVSAVFWWVFEYLNLHTLNWHYVNTDSLGAVPYALHATASFATVLPAVTGTAALLASVPWLVRGLERAPPMPRLAGRAVALGALLAGSAGLLVLPLAPRFTFPLLWLAPMLLLYGLAWLVGARSLHRALAAGDLRPAWVSALAALVCGVFWECWNWGSFAAWRYEVPWVDRFHLFEMPVVGYAGYLPFGIVCVLVAELAVGWCAGAPWRWTGEEHG